MRVAALLAIIGFVSSAGASTRLEVWQEYLSRQHELPLQTSSVLTDNEASTNSVEPLPNPSSPSHAPPAVAPVGSFEFPAASASTFFLGQLTTEYLNNPLGIDRAQPRFSWELTPLVGSPRGVSQTAYQIQLFTVTASSVTYLYDSGMVTSSRNHLIAYTGPALAADSAYEWRVRVWDSTGGVSAYSIATFSTGLFAASQWHGQWLSAAAIWNATGAAAGNQLRKEFLVDDASGVGRVSIHISGIGYYELICNGQKVGDRRMDVGWTNYGKRIYYSSYVLDLNTLRSGMNAFAVMLGNGWFSCAGNQPGCHQLPPQMRLQANIYSRSGTLLSEVVSDGSWEATAGPITYNGLYNGEHYDARLETPGWDYPGYQESGSWFSAFVIGTNELSGAIIKSAAFEPIRAIAEHPAVTINEPALGVFVVDFGRDFTGVVRIKVRGPTGSVVRLRHAEILNHEPYAAPDGNIYVGNLRSAQATDLYTLRGDGDWEVYEPRFTQHGFRYCEVTGLAYAPSIQDIVGIELHTDVRSTGSLEFSDNLLNTIQRSIQWGQLSNLMSVPTDCPQRDERRGWMGDAALVSEEASHNFAMGAFYTHYLDVIRDDQNADGSVCSYSPNLGDAGASDPNWQTAYPTIIWAMYQFYGDEDIVREHWPNLMQYLAFFDKQHSETGLAKYFYVFGDWVPPPPESMANVHLTSAFSYLNDIDMFIRLSQVNGTWTAAQRRARQTMLHSLRSEFDTAFYNTSTGTYGTGMQTELAMAIWIGAPKAASASITAALVHSIVNSSLHTTSGILGWRWILPVLSSVGRSDIALLLQQQNSYPSLGYMLEGVGNPEPSTTLWELWDTPSEGPGMNSRNHIMFGSNGGWLYQNLAGVKATSPGFDTVSIHPETIGIGSLTRSSARVSTPHGPIEMSWGVASQTSAVCVTTREDFTVTLDCAGSARPNAVLSSLAYASFGTPTGDCQSGFQNSSCNSPNSYSVVSAACLGRSSCSVTASATVFGGDPCYGSLKELAISMACGPLPIVSGEQLSMSITIPVGVVANVSVPILKGLTAAQVIMRESGSVMWQEGQFVPGVPGVLAGILGPEGTSVLVQLLSGSYLFTNANFVA